MYPGELVVVARDADETAARSAGALDAGAPAGRLDQIGRGTDSL